ncbi:hypothetical protein MSS4_00993 [Mycobacterium marinum]|nr:hypothetical protein MSS4_00993 [Mycobacterium marinum]
MVGATLAVGPTTRSVPARVMSVRRMVVVRDLASTGPVRAAAARAGLNAMTASTSQAALALKRPESR